jgi:hypothetical protein
MPVPLAGITASALGGLLALLLGLAASPVQAGNLVVNPGFDTDVNGWTVNNAAWDGTRDAAGSASSGSARSFRFLAGPNNCLDTISQCVTGLNGGTRYDFGGTILIPTSFNQTTGGQGSIGVQWYADTCGSALLGTDFGPIVDSTANADVWTPSSASGVTAPAGTTSALLIGRNCVLGVGNVEMFFDDMLFQPSPAFIVAVPTLDRGGLALLVALFAGVGLLALRRRG